MKIAYVSNTDLAGRIFNGYDLHLSLNSLGFDCKQIVVEKHSSQDTVVPIIDQSEAFVRGILRNLEYNLSMTNLLFPYGSSLAEMEEFKSADVVHYHLIHNRVLSLYDIEDLFGRKKTVWTVHDPWIVTGHCIHPLECRNWLTGCAKCERLSEETFPMKTDKAADMWKIKKEALRNINIDIVVSTDFMADYLKRSPITAHFNKIHKIPFGVDIDSICLRDRKEAKNSLGIDEKSYVIAFRAETNIVKGLKYITKALETLDVSRPVTVLTTGSAKLPLSVKSKINVVELGWLNNKEEVSLFYNAADVFLMPSLAETFGLMAIEAMAHECPVIIFDKCVLSEVTFAPECGLAVPYKDSKALNSAIKYLMENPKERMSRGQRGRAIVEKHYKYSDYVNKHINLYNSL